MSSAADAHVAWKPRHSPWLVAVSVMLATFMEVLDTSIANVSLPHIAGSMSATVDESTWVLTSYLVSNAIILSAASWLARNFGRKKYLAFSVSLFVVASMLCGLAQNMPQLIIARVLQGFGGGGLQPLAQAILLETFPPEEHGVAMAAYGMGVVVAPIIGPTLGGWITDNYSWRWLFYINVPIGLFGLFMQQLFLEDPPWIAQGKAAEIDYTGFGLMALGIGLFQVVLDKGQELDWFSSSWICWATAISVICLVAFALWELFYEEHPIMNLRLLKDRNFAVGTTLMGVTGGVLYGITAILPIFMQTLLGYTAYLSGLAMTPRGIGSFLAMLVVGRLMQRVDGRKLMTLGFLGLAATCVLFSHLTLQIASSNISWPLVLNGLTLGFVFVPMTTLAMSTLRRDQINQAASIYSLLRNLGAGIGISVMIAMQTRSAQGHQLRLISHLTPYDPAYVTRLRELAALLSRAGPGAARAAPALIYRDVLRQSTLLSFDDSFRWLTLICIACGLMVGLFRQGKQAGAEAHFVE